ncbi:putative patatin/cPLA2 family phospholipase [Erwinia toletana]|uniref:Patatin/cPLA2 family phospholipase n=1 Tax=Winslowiella toletana TaxID=92490 RepID=A0ABS4P5T9_9GAMM|nr:hypothetical protein [Winslowiella toletana]MBP2168004.1 putative patatin/cPLA2 family phospholipase [Winslowiella toletana]
MGQLLREKGLRGCFLAGIIDELTRPGNLKYEVFLAKKMAACWLPFLSLSLTPDWQR